MVFHAASLALVIRRLNYVLFRPVLVTRMVIFFISIEIRILVRNQIIVGIKDRPTSALVNFYPFGFGGVVFPIMTESIDRAGLVTYTAGFGSVVGAGRSLSLFPAMIASRRNHFGLRLAATSALAMIGTNTSITAGRLGRYRSVVPFVTKSRCITSFSLSTPRTASLLRTLSLTSRSYSLRPATPAVTKSRNRFRVARTAGTSIGFSSAGCTSGALCDSSSIAMSVRGFRGLSRLRLGRLRLCGLWLSRLRLGNRF